MNARIEAIWARAAESRAEYSSGEPDQPTRDIEYLLTLVDPAPTMPRGSWLWPDDHTAPERMTEHDERL